MNIESIGLEAGALVIQTDSGPPTRYMLDKVVTFGGSRVFEQARVEQSYVDFCQVEEAANPAFRSLPHILGLVAGFEARVNESFVDACFVT